MLLCIVLEGEWLVGGSVGVFAPMQKTAHIGVSVSLQALTPQYNAVVATKVVLVSYHASFGWLELRAKLVYSPLEFYVFDFFWPHE